MKVLVYAHELEIGGTQTNAIELAAYLRDANGWTVTLFATPGPAVALARARGLDYVAAPAALTHPSPARVQALWSTVRTRRPDVIHVWDWWQSLDACFLEALKGTPVLVSDMNMSVARVLPRSPATTFGTPELVDEARAQGFARAELLLPPVDCVSNAPGAVDSNAFRARFGIPADEFLLVTVSRVEPHLKGDSLRRSVTAMSEVGRDRAARLVIVGDGPLRGELESLAEQTNRAAGRTAVSLVGAMLDPREAYAAADAVVGMGGSALRGMAFAKPVVIVGAGGFAELFSEHSAPDFLYRGIYGQDWATTDDSRHRFAFPQVVAEGTRTRLGCFSRSFVLEHFALDKVGAVLAGLLSQRAGAGTKKWRLMMDGARTAAVMVRERRGLSHRLQKSLGLTR